MDIGQAFMLHQIRKMVGMAGAMMRGDAPANCIRVALQPQRGVPTPMAPEIGLFLDECYYDAYNTRYGTGIQRFARSWLCTKDHPTILNSLARHHLGCAHTDAERLCMAQVQMWSSAGHSCTALQLATQSTWHIAPEVVCLFPAANVPFEACGLLYALQ